MQNQNAVANFTPRAQQVLSLARKEAERFNHNFVGTEHLLLGLIRLGQGTAVTVLRKLGLDLETVRTEVEKQVGAGPQPKVLGHIPYTPRVKRVLVLAAREAKALNHTYVGTEHILLGLLGEGEGVASRVFQHLKVDIKTTRQEILKELDPNYGYSDKFPEDLEAPPQPATPQPQRDLVDLTKRYDLFCREGNEGLVIYRNVLFRTIRSLFPRAQYDSASEFLELEQADGQRVCVARSSVMKFCEHGVAPNPERKSGPSGPERA
jgi:ATP-dependent Clp protease ATP-binding subunit ClpA